MHTFGSVFYSASTALYLSDEDGKTSLSFTTFICFVLLVPTSEGNSEKRRKTKMRKQDYAQPTSALQRGQRFVLRVLKNKE